MAKPKILHKCNSKKLAFIQARREASLKGKPVIVIAPNRIDRYRVHPDGTEEKING